MKTTQLTPLAKILIVLVIAAVVLVPTYLLGGFESMFGGDKPVGPAATTVGSKATTTAGVVTPATETMNVSLDEWIGWKPIVDANKGLTTQAASIFKELGLNVKLHIINDATQSSNALINGSLDAAGYTINRYAFLYPKFIDNKVPVKMVYITNYSNGGDGIVSKDSITGIEGLVGKKIGIPRFSEAQTLVEWLLAKSNLTEADKAKIQKVYVDTPDDAAKAFFAGQLDAAATWQPYLSQAQETTGARILFSTKAATNLILDGIVFRADYIAAHPANVQKFVEGCLKAISLYTTEFAPIKDSMPLFATSSNDGIKAMTGDAALSDYSANINLFKGVAQTLFIDMSNVWKSIGEKSMGASVNDAFDVSILNTLTGKFQETKIDTPKFSEQQRQDAQKSNTALLTQRLSITFETGSATIKEESYASLKVFADTAKILNGVIIQIEGNTDSDGDAEANRQLSQKRAKAVATYLQFQDIDPTRFVVIGNGEDKPVADNGTTEGKAANRRTDAFFKVVN